MEPTKDISDHLENITTSYKSINDECEDFKNIDTWRATFYRAPLIVRLIRKILFFIDFTPKNQYTKPISELIGRVEPLMKTSLEEMTKAKAALVDCQVAVKTKGEDIEKIQKSVGNSFCTLRMLKQINSESCKDSLTSRGVDFLGRKLGSTCFADDKHYTKVTDTQSRINSLYNEMSSMAKCVISNRIETLQHEIRKEVFKLFQSTDEEIQNSLAQKIQEQIDELEGIYENLRRTDSQERAQLEELEAYLESIKPMIDACKEADQKLSQLRASVEAIFGDLNNDLRTSRDKMTIAYLGRKAAEPAIGFLRKVSIAVMDVMAKVFPFEGLDRARIFCEEYTKSAQISRGRMSKVKPFGGYNIVETVFDVAKALSRSPSEKGTRFALWKGDTVANLERLNRELSRGGKAAAAVCSNDTRLFGTAEISLGSQEEAVARQSNLFALADKMNQMRGSHHHHIPLMGTVYVKDAWLMRADGTDHFYGDLSMVAALDLRPGSDDRAAVVAAAARAGMTFDDFVFEVTRIKYAALLSSFLENGVTDALISLPGLGAYRNDVMMIHKVLQELLFNENAPFAGRFDRVIFNVKEGAQKAGLAENETAAMLGMFPRVDRTEFLGKDPYVESANEVLPEIVKSIAAKKSVAFHSAGVTKFLGNSYPCRINVDEIKCNSLQTAIVTKRVMGTLNKARVDNPHRASALEHDPLFLELTCGKPTPSRATRLGELLSGKYADIDSAYWTPETEHKQMWKLLKQKFELESFGDFLKETGDAHLLAHAPEGDTNSYWYDGHDGSGHNMLGRMLMAIRDEQEMPLFETKVTEEVVKQNKKSYDQYVLNQRLGKSDVYEVY